MGRILSLLLLLIVSVRGTVDPDVVDTTRGGGQIEITAKASSSDEEEDPVGLDSTLESQSSPNAEPLAALPGALFVDRRFNSDHTHTASGNSIPPDPHGAAGPSSIIAVVNVAIEARRKDGSLIFGPTLLITMFDSVRVASSSPFDPKIIYDVHEDRFVVVVDDSRRSNDSAYLLAVSKTSNPTSTTSADWWFTRVPFGVDGEWVDYPGIAVDEEALYITQNTFLNDESQCNPSCYTNSLLWIHDKSSLYSMDGSTAVTRHDYVAEAGSGSRTTHMPAMVRNPNGIAPSVGTYLVGSRSAFFPDLRI